MNPGWTPILRQLLDSSVWEEEPVVCKLWVTILLIASEPGRKGEIDMTVRSLAGRACLSPDDTKRALQRLCEPDPASRSTKQDGRRLVELDPGRGWGWRLVNWEEYQDVRKTAFTANRQTRRRKRDDVTLGHAASRSVTPRHVESHRSVTASLREGEGEGEGKGEKKEDCAEPLPRSTPSIVFPVVGNGKTWEPDDLFIAKLRETFPNLDILAELKKAALWAETHASQRKTARGMPAFLARWMERAVNSPHPNGNGKPAPAKKELTPEQLEKNRIAHENSRRELEEDARLQREETARRKAEQAQAVLPGVAA